MDIEGTLQQLAAEGNLRRIPAESSDRVVDLSSNDYLGLAADAPTRRRLLEYAYMYQLPTTSAASRLLGAWQLEYTRLEDMLSDLYPGRRALLFNSGYHANTGIIAAIADSRTLILADRLVHASIIDGIRLSGAPYQRFRHNDYAHLQRLVEGARDYANVLIITEGVFSMDGDRADIDRLAEIRDMHPGAMLYVDEAHSFGVLGPQGLGLVAASSRPEKVDIVVGTFGKALASQGAFSLTSERMRDYLINRCRSLIFSTAIPPVNVAWTRLLLEQVLTMDAERSHLAELGRALAAKTGCAHSGHIQPYIVGDARRTVALSERLLADGVKVLPIRTPTVPPGTERLRFSLSAALFAADIDRIKL